MTDLTLLKQLTQAITFAELALIALGLLVIIGILIWMGDE